MNEIERIICFFFINFVENGCFKMMYFLMVMRYIKIIDVLLDVVVSNFVMV